MGPFGVAFFWVTLTRGAIETSLAAVRTWSPETEQVMRLNLYFLGYRDF